MLSVAHQGNYKNKPMQQPKLRLFISLKFDQYSWQNILKTRIKLKSTIEIFLNEENMFLYTCVKHCCYFLCLYKGLETCYDTFILYFVLCQTNLLLVTYFSVTPSSSQHNWVPCVYFQEWSVNMWVVVCSYDLPGNARHNTSHL